MNPIQKVILFVMSCGLLALGGCNTGKADDGNSKSAVKKAPQSPQTTPSRTKQPPGKVAKAPGVGLKKSPVKKSAVKKSAVKKPTSAPKPTLVKTRSVYDFAQNGLLAHLWKGGPLIRPGHAGFLKYVYGNWWGNWVLFRDEDGKQVSYPGPKSRVRFPLPADHCRRGCELTLRMKILSCPQKVTVGLNGRTLGTTACVKGSDGYKTYKLPVSSEQVTSGENLLRFRFQRYRRRRGKSAGAALLELRLAARGDDRSGEVFYVVPPPKSFLRVASASNAKLRIEITPVGGKTRTLIERQGPIKDLVLPLDVEAGSAVRIQFDGRWSRRQLVTEAKPAGKRPAEKPRNVILWVVDTLRADALKIYNKKSRVKTPHYDKVIREGTTFQWGTAAAGFSLASHATILTGMTPARHRTMSGKSKMNPKIVMISEAFKKAGYLTAGFISNGYVSNKWGFQQGWSSFTNFIREGRPSHSGNMMPNITKWLRVYGKKKPFFMYVVTVDPHVAYRFREKYTLLYDDKKYKGALKRYVTGHHLDAIRGGRLKLNSRDKKRLKALYDGEVTYGDHYFGEFLKSLKKQGLDRNTLLIISSDHGDEFFEHGSVGHAQSLHGELVAVPMIFHLPGWIPSDQLVRLDAEHLDLMPTICDMLGVKIPDRVQGRSLAPIIFSRQIQMPSPVFSSQGLSAKGLKMDEWRYILHRNGKEQLYRVSQDPTEQHNLSQKRPIALRWARDVLSFWLPLEKRWHKPSWGDPANHKSGVEQQIYQRFKVR